MENLSRTILYELNKGNYRQGDINLYHFDNEKYNIGDTIIKHNNLTDIVKNTYKKYINLDATKLIYMLSFINDEYWESYKYCYEVDPESLTLVQMDYSPIMADDFINITFKDIDKNQLEVKKVVDLFAKSYLGDVNAKEQLQKKYNYTISNKEEYVSDLPVKVLEIYEDK